MGQKLPLWVDGLISHLQGPHMVIGGRATFQLTLISTGQVPSCKANLGVWGGAMASTHVRFETSAASFMTLSLSVSI